MLALRKERSHDSLAVVYALDALGPGLAGVTASYLRANGGPGMDFVVVQRLAGAHTAPGQTDEQRDAWLTLGAALPRDRRAGIRMWQREDGGHGGEGAPRSARSIDQTKGART
jgi:hypothetical protein